MPENRLTLNFFLATHDDTKPDGLHLEEVPLIGYHYPPRIDETIQYNNKYYKVLDVVHSSIVNHLVHTQQVNIFIGQEYE